MKQIQTESAVGKTLAYDTTIVDRNMAGTLLKRGHAITEEDVAILKNSGVYKVWIEEEDKNDNIAYEWEISNYLSHKIADSDTIDIVNGEHGASYLFSKIPGLANFFHPVHFHAQRDNIDCTYKLTCTYGRELFLCNKKNRSALVEPD